MSVGNKSMFMFDGKWYLLSIQHVNIQPLIRIKINFSQIDDSKWNKKPFFRQKPFSFRWKGLKLEDTKKISKGWRFVEKFFVPCLCASIIIRLEFLTSYQLNTQKKSFFFLLLHSKKRDFQIKLCVGIFFLLLVFSVKFNNLKKFFAFLDACAVCLFPFPIKKLFALKMCVAALQSFVEFRALMI